MWAEGLQHQEDMWQLRNSHSRPGCLHKVSGFSHLVMLSAVYSLVRNNGPLLLPLLRELRHWLLPGMGDLIKLVLPSSIHLVHPLKHICKTSQNPTARDSNCPSGLPCEIQRSVGCIYGHDLSCVSGRRLEFVHVWRSEDVQHLQNTEQRCVPLRACWHVSSFNMKVRAVSISNLWECGSQIFAVWPSTPVNVWNHVVRASLWSERMAGYRWSMMVPGRGRWGQRWELVERSDERTCHRSPAQFRLDMIGSMFISMLQLSSTHVRSNRSGWSIDFGVWFSGGFEVLSVRAPIPTVPVWQSISMLFEKIEVQKAFLGRWHYRADRTERTGSLQDP